MTGSTVSIRLRAYRGEQHDTTECFNGLRDEAADLIDSLIAERDRTRAEVAACRKDAERLDWLQRHFFERKWDGTIGRKCDWYLVGNYRHVAQRMRGDTFREAIDAALGGEGKDDAAQ